MYEDASSSSSLSSALFSLLLLIACFPIIVSSCCDKATKVDAMAHHPGYRGTCWSRAAEPLAKHLYAQHLSRLPCSVTLPEWWMVRPTLQPPSFIGVILTITVVGSFFPSTFTCLLPHHCLSCCEYAETKPQRWMLWPTIQVAEAFAGIGTYQDFLII